MTKQTTIPIDELIEDPENMRKRTDRNREALDTSLETYGAARSIVVDKDGVVRAGNGTLAAAKEAGITEVVVVEGGPGKLIAVRRADWSEEDAKGYAIMDNKSAELAEWDYEGLAEFFEEADRPPEDFGFLPEEVDALSANVTWDGVEQATAAGGRKHGPAFSATRFQVTVLDEEHAAEVEEALNTAMEKLGSSVVVEKL